MIEVTFDTGDRIEAKTPEDALYGALHVAREIVAAAGTWGRDPVMRFIVDGTPVRTTSLRALTR